MTPPLISVVLPTYNRAGTLERAIRTVLGQTFRALELIVVDDGSTDGTAAVLAAIGDERLRPMRLPRNRGAAAARNAGLAEARAAWIAFQDSDDEWLPQKLDLQWQVAAEAPPEVGLILGGYLAEQQSRRTAVRPASILSGGDAQPDLLDGWPIITPTWLARKSLLDALGGFDTSYACLEDWDLVFRMADRCIVRAVEGPVLVKHGGTDTVCGDPRRLAAALERILDVHARRWDGHEYRRARRLAHLGCLRFALGERDAAQRALRRALAGAPLAPAAHGLFWASLAGPRAMNLARRWWPHFASMSL